MEAEQVHGPSRRTRGKKRVRTPEPPASAGPSTPATPATPSQASQDEGEEPSDEVSSSSQLDQLTWQLLIAFRSEVVGIQHYNGLVGAGEYVMLRRQPENPYDGNAVQVRYLPRRR